MDKVWLKRIQGIDLGKGEQVNMILIAGTK